MTTRSIVFRLIGLAAIVFLGFVLNFFMLPAWSFRSSSMYWFLLLLFVIATILFGFIEWLLEELKIATIISACGCGVIVIIGIISFFTSAQIFHASSYQSLIDIEEGNFTKEVVTVNNLQNISVVDVATAQKVGDRTIAALENPSWYEVDNEYNLIIYNGEQYRLSPINYGGFFKYMKADTHGIPGYVLVNSITQEATLVTLDSPIRYSPSACFSYDLSRHLRNQYPSYIFGTSFFEIDDDGNPYWITSVKTPTIGLTGGLKESSFIITDACTGKSNEYSVENLPEWVDHAFDLDYLMDLVYYNYEYINGFFNFSKTGVNRTSYNYRDSSFIGYNTTLSTDGVVFYTGVTPANNAESVLGFLLANPRTGVVKFYDCSGAEESSAQAAAQGLVQNLGYIATFPTIINVDGIPTYFMTLKDNAGLIQRYALCNVANYTQVFQASSLEDTLTGYRTLLGKEDIPQEEPIKMMSASGEIAFLYTAEIDGYTYFYFTLTGSSNLYMSSIENSNRQVLLQIGTNVNIEYTPSSEADVYLVQSISF